MRLLTVGNLFPPHHLGGYELVWQNAVRDLRRRGHDVRVLVTDHTEPGRGAEAEEPDVHRDLRWYWRDHEFPRRSLRERRDIERHNAGVLAGHLAGFQPDVVSWWPMGGMSLALIERVRRAGIPAVGVILDEWLEYATRVDQWVAAFDRPVLGAVVERLTGLPTSVDFASAARWLFISAYVRDFTMERRPGLTSVGLAHPGIDTELMQPAPAAGEWRWRMLYLGRIDRRKGIETAIRALALLPAHATLTVSGDGDGDERRRLDAIVAELGLGDRVVFRARGPREGVPAEIAESDVVVFPVTWPEPWGLVPIEAMGVGRPVVATGTGGSAEFLADEDNCLVVAPGDAAAHAAAIGRLAADPVLRARLLEGGRRTAAMYTEAAFHAVVAAEHERAAATRGPPAPDPG